MTGMIGLNLSTCPTISLAPHLLALAIILFALSTHGSLIFKAVLKNPCKALYRWLMGSPTIPRYAAAVQ
jgi:hypothetical protein